MVLPSFRNLEKRKQFKLAFQVTMGNLSRVVKSFLHRELQILLLFFKLVRASSLLKRTGISGKEQEFLSDIGSVRLFFRRLYKYYFPRLHDWTGHCIGPVCLCGKNLFRTNRKNTSLMHRSSGFVFIRSRRRLLFFSSPVEQPLKNAKEPT